MKDYKRLHLIYGIILSVLIITCGILLIISCLDIYHSGNRPFSPQSISIHFQKISLLVYITLSAIAGGIAVHLVFPVETKGPKAIKDDDAPLKIQERKAGELLGQFQKLSKDEETYRRTIKIICAVFFGLMTILPLLYFTNINNFTVKNLNQDVIKSLIIAFVPCCIGLCACHYCKYLCRKSYQRQAEIYKDAIRANCCKKSDCTPPPSGQKILYIRGIVAILAVCFILLGIFNGGARDVLLKAIAICTECIGLG